MQKTLYLLLASQLCGSALCAQQSLTVDVPAAYSGRDGSVAVPIPRLNGDVKVDGVLDEALWRNAAHLAGFSEYTPVDGLPAEDATEVLVFYGEHGIYFAIRALETHTPINARLADRDKIDSEDYVQLMLDTFNDHRRALIFGANPLGVQSDGVRSEGGQAVRAGFGEQQDLTGLDLSPDFVYESKGRVDDKGYVVEMRIPFKTLRFQSDRVQTWGFNVLRKVQHSGHQQTWTQVRLGNNSFLGQSGTLTGLTELRRGVVLDFTPAVTWKATGTPTVAPSPAGWSYDSGAPQLGGNMRWGVTPNLSLNATVKPDFSQVEADVAQVQALPRNAISFPEKRPFFLEGIEQLQTPKQMIYTRNIVQPIAAAKLSGKISGTDVGFISAVDDRITSTTGSNPVYNLLRARRDLGRRSWFGGVYTDKVDGDTYNRVGGLDSRIVFGGKYYLQFQGTGSITRQPGYDEKVRPLYHFVFDRTGRSWVLHSETFGVHPQFLAGSGFLSRGSIFQSNINSKFNFFGKKGDFLESTTYTISMDGLWDYNNFFNRKTADEVKFHHTLNFSLRGGWRVGPFLYLENFYYPPQAYSTYRLQRTTPTGTEQIPFTADNQLLRNLDFGFGMSTPRTPKFDGSANILVGYDDNFFEWAQAYIWLSTFIANVRPTDKIRVEARYVRQQYIRMSDHSNVGLRNIPRLKVEYQVKRPIFVRFVGQYDARFVDVLRDDGRSNLPIAILNTRTGKYDLTKVTNSNSFRGDFLFAYQPNPGTVFFLGYGSTLAEPEAFRFKSFDRTTDGFFVKVSYLFRM